MIRLTPILLLAACAVPCPQDQIVCDPATQTCICERPTATLSAIDKRGDRTTKAPAKQTPGDKTVDDSGMFDGKEPDSRTDPEGYQQWKDTRSTGWRK